MTARARHPPIDALRALAALSVLAFHAVGFFAGGLRADAAIRPYVARLDVGVSVFLLISGFLLYRPFARAHLGGGPSPRIGAYAWRRVLRIVPAYWVALLVATLVLGLPGVLTASGVATYFGLAQLYSRATVGGGIAPAWTLSLELSFYAFLPVWALLVRLRSPADPAGRLRRELAALGLLAAASVAYKAALFAAGAVGSASAGPTPLLSTLPAYLDQFALGMALAVASVAAEERGDGRLSRAAVRLRPAAWLLALVAFWVVATRVGLTGDPAQRWGPGRALARHLLYALVAAALLAPAALGPAGAVPRRWSPLGVAAWLGLVSYGVYLWHWPVLLGLNELGLGSVDVLHPYLRWGVAATLLSVALGALSFALVERPALRLAGVSWRPVARRGAVRLARR